VDQVVQPVLAQRQAGNEVGKNNNADSSVDSLQDGVSARE
jgi:hypothetical protein